MGNLHVTVALRSVVVFPKPIPDPECDNQSLETVASVDVDRYLGRWYEIASCPVWSRKNCMAITADYSHREDGLIKVVKSYRKGSLKGKLKQATGRAKVVDQATNAKLKVSFFGPFWGDYWIIDLDPDYQWAVVGVPNRRCLWILGRTPQMEDSVFDGIVSRLPAKGYDPGRVKRTPQPEAVGPE